MSATAAGATFPAKVVTTPQLEMRVFATYTSTLGRWLLVPRGAQGIATEHVHCVTCGVVITGDFVWLLYTDDDRETQACDVACAGLAR